VTLLSSCEFRANLRRKSLTLLRGGKQFLSVLNSPVRCRWNPV